MNRSNSEAPHDEAPAEDDGRETPPLEAYHDEFSEAEERAQEEIRVGKQLRLEREALFAHLNDRQREAVFMPNQSALVLAAAGSGKTSVLTARIAHLITKGAAPVHPRAILAVTFTNKASIEMRDRLRKLLDRRTVNTLWVGTFHSLCNRMLRDNAEAAGLPKSFAILDVDGQQAMCRGILKDLGLTRSAVKESKAKKVASAQVSMLFDGPDITEGAAAAPTADERLAAAGALSAQEADVVDGGDAGEFVTPAQCANYINSRKEAGQAPRPPVHVVSPSSQDVEQMEAVFFEYQTRCNRSGLLDFQDLLTRTVKLLEEDRGVREAMQARFETILVDEFQDTNDIQYRWLSLLKSPTAHVMAVGDDDQSIYAFRGAKPENMGLFLRDMASRREGTSNVPGSMIKLEHNYRSLPHILEVANAIIDRNTNRLGKILRTDKPDSGEFVDLAFFGGGNFEATAIADSIHEMVRDKGVQPSEIAILYRANQQSRILEAELNKRGLPLTVYGGFRFYERQEVKFVLSYLSLICDPDHDIALAKVANFPPRGLGERTLEELRQDAQIKDCTMLDLIVKRAKEREEGGSFPGGMVALKKQMLMEQFADIILGLFESSQNMPLHELIQATIERSGLGAHYAAEAAESGGPGEGGDERLANMGELVSAACQFLIDNSELEEQDTVSQLTEYLAHVALMTSTSESDMNAKNTISLMTVHSAKGLEFDHVFVTGLEEKSFPHARAIDEDAVWVPENPKDRSGDGPAIQEERRLMYVAVTRARKTLQLSHCSQRLVNGEIRQMDASRFIGELPAHRIRHIDDRQEKGSPQKPVRNAFAGLARGPRSAAGASAPPAARSTSDRRRVALIGTAGRDKEHATSMTPALWQAMVTDAQGRVRPTDAVISGGAAWADHLAVRLFLDGHAAALQLHLPAPLGADGRFVGPGINAGGSAASAANYYHDLFKRSAGVDGLKDIAQAIARGATVTAEPEGPGYGAMMARNKHVAAGCDNMVAYTWGDADIPADGGTKSTWDMARNADRVHVGLAAIAHADSEVETEGFGFERPMQRA